jgi:hypothetical protein
MWAHINNFLGAYKENRLYPTECFSVKKIIISYGKNDKTNDPNIHIIQGKKWVTFVQGTTFLPLYPFL